MEFNNDEREDLKNEDVEEENVEENVEESSENNDDKTFKEKIFEKLKTDDKITELDKVLKENQELTSGYQRLQADFLNYKKRVEKEKESLISYGVETLVVDILPVLDNFERALEIEKDKEDSFFKGIDMTYTGLREVLDKNSIKEIDAMHKPFNPEYHHAVGMEENEEFEKNTVIRILQKGYTMKDKVIRHSMVIVSQ